jgi:hypothetical protein
MAKRTKTPEELEWEATREERERWMYRLLNERWREMAAREEGARTSTLRRRFFPWRIRLERLN